ncbi:MAG: family 16 glycoside hydrolase [Planctomycetota bacterium]
MTRFLFIALLFVGCFSSLNAHGQEAPPLSVLLVDGQNNHKWQQTTPLIKASLEQTGRFRVDVVTSPDKQGDMASFKPDFASYDVVVSNYNGKPWSDATKKAFENYVAGGGGFVSVHAADNAFPKWSAYNRMIGLGGWGGRNESDGPYVRWKEDAQRFTRDTSPGKGGAHGKRTPFLIIVRDQDHPITRGLPVSFMQAEDELYAQLRGPAENMHVLATAYADPATRGSGQHEPILMTIRYGKGRVFHTTLGHDATAMSGVAFQATLNRGTEWAATGKVTLTAVDATTLPSDRAASRSLTDDSGSIPDLTAGGWKSLFNGKDLKGWEQKNGYATYRIEDGAIVGKTAEASPNSFMCTSQTYQDFELTFEVDVDPKLNSGVQIRSATKEGSGRVYGAQVEIESAPGESGYIYGEATSRGWITKEQPIKDAYQNGVWNRYIIRANGDRLQTWVNGRLIADIQDAESNQPGFIGLQVHGIKQGTGPYEVRWRDIRIRRIAD